jgi:hypothetical protein
MWVLTEIADGYDKIRKDNETWLANVMKQPVDDFLGGVVYTTAAAARFLNAVPGAFGGGFIDVLRLGDGVKEGGWGYGKDALRLLAVAGPAIRAGRYGLALVASVDEAATVGNCTWVAASRALRMTGTKHFAKIGDLAKAFGISLQDTGGAWPTQLIPGLQVLGADARTAAAVTSFEEVANLARSNPNGLVMFCIRFGRVAGSQAKYLADTLHTLIAVRVGGVVLIIDRSGRVYRSLAELGAVYGAAPELGMTIASEAGLVIINNARVVNLQAGVEGLSWLINAIGVELRGVPSPNWASPVITLKTDQELLVGCGGFGSTSTFGVTCSNERARGKGMFAGPIRTITSPEGATGRCAGP